METGEVSQNEEFGYHYTTIETAWKILKFKTLHLTDYRFMNDSKEYYSAGEMFAEILKNYDFAQHTDYYLTKVGNTAEDRAAFETLIANLKRKASSDLFRLHPMNRKVGVGPYIFSMSYDGDSLSQWRAYGSGEICLKFNLDELRKAANSSWSKIVKVEYTPDNLVRFFASWFKRQTESWIKDRLACGSLNGEIISESVDDLRGAIFPETLEGQVRPFSFKHKGFADEKEVRLIVWGFSAGHGSIKRFINAGRYFVPKIELPLHERTNLDRVITGLVFGPGTDEERAKISLAALNEELGVSYDLNISKIPFRS